MSVSVNIPDELASRLTSLAAERSVTLDELTAELLSEHIVPDRPSLARFIGIGASTSGRRAAEDEEMLAEGFGR